ncbi:hypothetical protein LTR62_000867 [Meristemomyces frigidus]|uniref:Cytochrome P450 n=1 Tax=Meristemomyces frigidus TaxID=1508187 RepID=A0AAN7TMF5_9PEZI|nr:hypothetical protein LTR62_000867 [Meristemomyces frigidus]
MLRYLVDRLWTPTLLCTLASFTIYSLRNISPRLVTYSLLALVAVYYGQLLTTAVSRELQLSRLGKRAASRRTFTPYNFGMLFEAIYYVLQHRNHEFWWKLFEKSGNATRPWTVESIVAGERIIFTSDEDNIKAILATQFSDYGKGPQFRKEWKDFLGLSIFTTDGDIWHQSRTLLRPQFIKDRVSDLHTFEKHTQILIRLLRGTGNGATVQADDLYYRFTLDAATDFLLGKSVESLENGQTEFAQAFAQVQNTQSIIARAGPLQHLIPKAKFHAGLKVLNRFVGTYIDRALELPQKELEEKTKSDEGYTFLHAIAAYTRDRDVLRDQLVAVLLAGRDTTAVTLSWLTYELSRSPQIVQKLRQEIISTVGLEEVPTYDNLKNMRYLQHTLNEILRLYPVVPYNVRVALQDTTLPRGGGKNGDEPIGILKDTPIGYSTLILQRREDIYPSEATGFAPYLSFVPERWDHWTPKAWTYIPFNGGPRICIGQQFALTELAYTTVRLLQTFDRIECRMDGFPLLRTDIVLQPAKGVHVAFWDSKMQS